MKVLADALKGITNTKAQFAVMLYSKVIIPFQTVRIKPGQLLNLKSLVVTELGTLVTS